MDILCNAKGVKSLFCFPELFVRLVRNFNENCAFSLDFIVEELASFS